MAVATAPIFDPELDQLVADEVVTDLAARIGGKNVALRGHQAGSADGRWRQRRYGRHRDLPDRPIREWGVSAASRARDQLGAARASTLVADKAALVVSEGLAPAFILLT